MLKLLRLAASTMATISFASCPKALDECVHGGHEDQTGFLRNRGDIRGFYLAHGLCFKN